MDDVSKIDVYELLNISYDADLKEIKKAYRKKALSCHPDKNPDNPKAAILFQQLSKALELLSDEAARAAYDKVLRAKKAAIVRNQHLDDRRKKLKEDLEARERAAYDGKADGIDEALNLQKEIERLRKEGSRLVEEEKELLRKKIEEEKAGIKQETKELPRLKVKWKVQKDDKTNGGYTDENLKDIFSKHGEVTCLVVSSKKRGSALVEFSAVGAAQSAFEFEAGRPENPFTLSWICGQPTSSNNSQETLPSKREPVVTSKGPPPAPDSNSTLTYRDYESIVLMKLRQAEERKRLIQQMTEEDDEN